MVFREEVDVKHVNKGMMKDALPVRATVVVEAALVKEVLENVEVVVALVVTKEGDFSKQTLCDINSGECFF